MNNSRFPWVILVPMRDGMRELYDLNETDYHAALTEVRHTTQYMQCLTQAYKMNMACLGNQVEQLHIHIIARFQHDDNWPKPVWSTAKPAESYPDAKCLLMLEMLRPILNFSNITKM